MAAAQRGQWHFVSPLINRPVSVWSCLIRQILSLPLGLKHTHTHTVQLLQNQIFQGLLKKKNYLFVLSLFNQHSQLGINFIPPVSLLILWKKKKKTLWLCSFKFVWRKMNSGQVFFSFFFLSFFGCVSSCSNFCSCCQKLNWAPEKVHTHSWRI